MNPNAIIRRATIHDLEEILAVEKAGFTSEAFTRRQLRYLLTRARGIVLAAVSDNRTVGYLSLLTSARHGQARIYSLAVMPRCRGQGLAEGLVDAALAFAREKGLKAVFLEVEAGNLAALSLYRKKGFIEHGIKPRYYRNGTDALSMVRREAGD